MHYYHPPEKDDVPSCGRGTESYVLEDCSCAVPCPRCGQAMILRYRVDGPYFHCACRAEKRLGRLSKER